MPWAASLYERPLAACSPRLLAPRGRRTERQWLRGEDAYEAVVRVAKDPSARHLAMLTAQGEQDVAAVQLAANHPSHQIAAPLHKTCITLSAMIISHKASHTGLSGG